MDGVYKKDMSVQYERYSHRGIWGGTWDISIIRVIQRESWGGVIELVCGSIGSG